MRQAETRNPTAARALLPFSTLEAAHEACTCGSMKKEVLPDTGAEIDSGYVFGSDGAETNASLNFSRSNFQTGIFFARLEVQDGGVFDPCGNEGQEDGRCVELIFGGRWMPLTNVSQRGSPAGQCGFPIFALLPPSPSSRTSHASTRPLPPFYRSLPEQS
ncbi:hypothetical protein KM043_000338 [Ampulex compressa]|nr:hypothetical protein KM043_000338 [Ampulex compressa]